MTTRRAFLLSTGALALGAARRASAQPATRVYRVAFLATATGRDTPFMVAMERRFREMGYVEGKNFALEYRTAAGRREKFPEIAAELARTRPDVAIAAGSEFALKAFRQTMGTTPIVMIAVDYDPVERNFIASLARPGGNITGVFLRQVESAAKRLELLKEALPKVTRVAALFDFAGTSFTAPRKRRGRSVSHCCRTSFAAVRMTSRRRWAQRQRPRQRRCWRYPRARSWRCATE